MVDGQPSMIEVYKGSQPLMAKSYTDGQSLVVKSSSRIVSKYKTSLITVKEF